MYYALNKFILVILVFCKISFKNYYRVDKNHLLLNKNNFIDLPKKMCAQMFSIFNNKKNIKSVFFNNIY